MGMSCPFTRPSSRRVRHHHGTPVPVLAIISCRGEQMSDDFGTVNARRGDRAREIDVMRQQYRTHRDTLQRLAADAPTYHLAAEDHRLSDQFATARAKLAQLGTDKPTAGAGRTPF